jgi:hypothetical protein
MKLKIQLLAGICLFVSSTFFACKKNTAEADYATELSNQSDDQSRFTNETDAVANDANSVMDNYTSFTGREAATLALPCDATVVTDTVSNPRTITITYNGLNCQGTRTRTGVVKLSMPSTQRWKDAGAVLTVTITNLKITRLSDNKSITINGTKTITNVSGGLLRNLASLNSITHTITSSGITVTFDDGSTRSWQIAKKRVFTYNNGIVITTTGTYSDNGTTGISEWGTNRNGNAFVTSITQPLVVRQDCNFRLTSGQVTHSRLIATGVVTFGLDASGNPTSCPSGTYYFKLVWTGANGVTRTVILPY